MPRRGRKDSTQDTIANIWSGHGFWVLDLHDAAGTFQFAHDGERIAGGIADLLCVFGPYAVFVECKAERGRPEKAERAFQAACDVRGVPYLIEYNADEAERHAMYHRSRALRRQL